MLTKEKSVHLEVKQEDHISSRKQHRMLIHMDTDKSGVENLRGRVAEKTVIGQNTT